MSLSPSQLPPRTPPRAPPGSSPCTPSNSRGSGTGQITATPSPKPVAVPKPLTPRNKAYDDPVTNDSDARAKYVRHIDRAKNCLIGPMPLDDFFNDERLCPPVPEDGPVPPSAGVQFSERMKGKCDGDEKHINKALADAVHEPLTIPERSNEKVDICPGFAYHITENHADHPGTGGSKPDFMFFRSDEAGPENDGRSNFSQVELIGETKKRKNNPFEADPPKKEQYNQDYCRDHKLLKTNNKILKGLGQTFAYSSLVSARQYRTFVYTILICGPYARILRFDRGGTIVTRAFDITEPEGAQHLCDFLWRFSRASLAQRGHDLSHTTTDAEEESTFKDVIEGNVKLQMPENTNQEKLDNERSRHYSPGCVAKVKVRNKEGGSPIEVMVSVPLGTAEYSDGRGTRGYWAASKSTKNDEKTDWNSACLKDGWRTVAPNLQCEGANQSNLKKSRHIPTVLGFGDVDAITEDLWEGEAECKKYQTTVTHEYVHAPWSCLGGRSGLKLYEYKHYRLLVVEAGETLDHFEHGLELFRSADEILDALKTAYDSGYLHRDVSYGNIILYREKAGEDRKAMLIDWEYACRKDRDGFARDHCISGTRQFMSIAALRAGPGSGFQHSLNDDVESLFYVIYYCAVVWLDHELQESLKKKVNRFFLGPDDETPDLTKEHYASVPKRFREELGKFRFNPYVENWIFDAHAFVRTIVKNDAEPGRVPKDDSEANQVSKEGLEASPSSKEKNESQLQAWHSFKTHIKESKVLTEKAETVKQIRKTGKHIRQLNKEVREQAAAFVVILETNSVGTPIVSGVTTALSGTTAISSETDQLGATLLARSGLTGPTPASSSRKRAASGTPATQTMPKVSRHREADEDISSSRKVQPEEDLGSDRTNKNSGTTRSSSRQSVKKNVAGTSDKEPSKYNTRSKSRTDNTAEGSGSGSGSGQTRLASSSKGSRGRGRGQNR